MSDQEMLPGLEDVPLRSKVKLVGNRKAPVDKIAICYHHLRGPLVHQVDWIKAKTHAKKILAAGFSVDEAIGCIEWLNVHPKYGPKNWSVAFVGKLLPQYRREHEQESAAEHQFSRVPKDWKW